jgi:hypothetical protein
MTLMRVPAADQAQFLPAPNLATYQFDRQGIPMKHYGETVGWQYEPIVAIYYGIHYLREYVRSGDERLRQRLAEMLEWLLGQLHTIGSPGAQGLTLYCFYDYRPYVLAPWVCGMNNGRLIELLLDADAKLGTDLYADTIEKLADGLLVPPEHGGICYEFGDGCVLFEEFGSIRPLLWSLNGHCSVIVSLQKLLAAKPNPKLEDYVRRGIAAVVRDVRYFDVDPSSGGSKVKLYGYGMIRLRPKGSGATKAALGSLTLHYPQDQPPLTIDIGRSSGSEHIGWSVYKTETSHLQDRTLVNGRSARETTRAIFKVAMSDLFQFDDTIRVEIEALVTGKEPMQVEFYPDADKKYVLLGEIEPDPDHWQSKTFTLSCGYLARVFGNVVDSKHGYHDMNTDYVEKLAPFDPTGTLAVIAQRWRSRIVPPTREPAGAL